VSEILKYKMKLIALTDFSRGVTEWTKLSFAFVNKSVIRSSFPNYVPYAVFLFGGFNTHFQNVISADVEKRPFNFIQCAHLRSIVSVVNHEDM
jgi:hypothetical protein